MGVLNGVHSGHLTRESSLVCCNTGRLLAHIENIHEWCHDRADLNVNQGAKLREAWHSLLYLASEHLAGEGLDTRQGLVNQEVTLE